MASDPEAVPDHDLDWSRPHPITIIVEIGTAFRSLIIAIIILRAGGGVLGTSAVGEFLVIGAPLGAGLARWYTTRYALGPESVHYRYGLIRRTKQVLPRSNIQNVSTKAGVISRMASVVELQISDASSTGDIRLRLIAQEEAERLTTLLRSSMPGTDGTGADLWAGNGGGSPTEGRPGPPTGPPLPFPPPAGPVLGGVESGRPETVPRPTVTEPVGVPVRRPPVVEPSLREVLVAEATSMSSLASLIASAAILTTGFALAPRYSFALLPNRGEAAGIALVAAIPLFSALLTVAARFPVLGGFQLHADPDRLRIQAGLLTETKVAARRERIQQLAVARDLPHQWLGIERVRYETADVELQTTAASRYLDPAASVDGWKALAETAIGGTTLDESSLEPVSPITIRRSLVRMIPLAVIPVVVGGLLHPVGLVGGALGWVAFTWWYTRRRYRVLGWAVDDDHYLVRTGVFYERLILIRVDKIQNLRLSSTLPQRRYGLATLSVSTAGAGAVGLISLPDLPRATGERLLDQLASRSARTPIDETL